VVNLQVIRTLLDAGTVVIAGGGGGIPVVRGTNGDWQGVQAVVDKDLTSALLARSLGIPDLLILTAVDRVAVDFNTPRQRFLDRVTLAEMKEYQRAGHFARGSMGPKVEAAIRHLEAGGRRAIIAHLERALPALAGETGTHVVR
jgi:carbamate kinase